MEQVAGAFRQVPHQLINALFIGVEVVETEFVICNRIDGNGGTDTQRQSEGVNYGIGLVSEDIAPGDLEIILEHIN